MSLERIVKPHIRALEPYQPGKPIEELERELGISGAIKVASNENPLGPSPRALAALPAALPQLHLYPDAGGYALRRALAARLGVADTSIALARMVASCNLQHFEQPVPADDIEGMARVRREANAVGVPVMADESVLDHASLIRIIQAGAADIVKVKVMKQGGFLNTRRMISTAEAAGIRCVVGHGFGLGVNTMAEIMLAATSNNVVDGLECVGPLKTSDDIVTHKLDLSAGSIALPGGPGLGVTLDEAKLGRYRFEAKAAA